MTVFVFSFFETRNPNGMGNSIVPRAGGTQEVVCVSCFFDKETTKNAKWDGQWYVFSPDPAIQ